MRQLKIVAKLAKVPNPPILFVFLSPVVIGAFISLPALTLLFEENIFTVLPLKIRANIIKPITATMIAISDFELANLLPVP